MNIRQTSINCYNQIKSEGLLSKRRFQAYEYLCIHAPCTASELQSKMVYKDGGRDVQKRLSELRKLGVIKEIGVRECGITGLNVIEWDLTENLPNKPEAVISGKQLRINIAIGSLRDLYVKKKKATDTDEDWLAMSRIIDKI